MTAKSNQLFCHWACLIEAYNEPSYWFMLILSIVIQAKGYWLWGDAFTKSELTLHSVKKLWADIYSRMAWNHVQYLREQWVNSLYWNAVWIFVFLYNTVCELEIYAKMAWNHVECVRKHWAISLCWYTVWNIDFPCKAEQKPKEWLSERWYAMVRRVCFTREYSWALIEVRL